MPYSLIAPPSNGPARHHLVDVPPEEVAHGARLAHELLLSQGR
ncbi:hypothetical protein ACFV80_16450 [Streptomyces sp. NPDC059862]